MKLRNIKIFGALIGVSLMTLASCDKFLDREPLTEVTPGAYFSSAEQLGAYTIAQYDNTFKSSTGRTLYHPHSWDAGVTLNDDNTDNLVASMSQGLFAGEWQVGSGQSMLRSFSSAIRNWNWFFEQVLPKKDKIQGGEANVNQYIGEAYFLRAMIYYRALCNFGDFPIVTEVLTNDREELIKFSQRKPRNEVARFILEDLDKAISLLKDKGFESNVRINKQAALLFKSRVALYEGTFEKYHKGSGRVPGDANWPGKDSEENKGKTFDIDKEVEFFLGQAMDAAKQVAESITLTNNSGVYEPSQIGITTFNPYYEMFSSVDLSGNSEVILWKQYSSEMSVRHDAAYILTAGGNRIGLTRSFVNSFIMKNGLPIYAEGSGYPGDAITEKEAEGRDDRMNLFVFHKGMALRSDPSDPLIQKEEKLITLDTLNLIVKSDEDRNITGYRPRKYTTYDYSQMVGNQVICTTGSIVFRGVEAYLNYMEACYEKNHSLDATAQGYWKAIRRRAGVDEDFNKTIQNTDLDKEFHLLADGKTVVGDIAVYSGDKKVDATLYNIRRERRCEFISEGFRWDDLIRWRSWDNFVSKYKFQPEGINFWTNEYKNYTKENGKEIIADPANSKSNLSAKSVSIYLRPLSRSQVNNPLFEGYTWRKAFYLSPLGVEDFTITNKTLYQNPYWPEKVGKAIE